MQLENSFEVPAPIERVWEFLLDVERVASCMPGAELTEVVDERTWKGKVNVKLGPVSLSYAGTVVMQEKDESGRRVVLNARGTETRGKGTASAIGTAQMLEKEGGTRVEITTDLTLTGSVAQMGRGMIADVAQRLTGDFAECVSARIIAAEAGAGGTGAQTPLPTARPVRGFRLAIWAFFRAIGRFFRRIGSGAARS